MHYAAGYEILAINQIKASDVTFDNTIKALIDLEREMITEEGPIFLPQHVVTDKAIRDASVAADKKLSTFEVDLSMKKEVSLTFIKSTRLDMCNKCFWKIVYLPKIMEKFEKMIFLVFFSCLYLLPKIRL